MSPFEEKTTGEGLGEFRDRQEEILELADRDACEAAIARISDAVIEEHRARPQGPHSDDLARILRYLRSQPMEGKLAVVRLERNRYRLCRTSGQRGVEPTMEDDVYGNANEAIHAAFLSRISELQA